MEHIRTEAQLVNKNIVVIDEDPDVQERVEAFFRTRGFMTTHYNNAESALLSFATHGASWDIILSDLHLSQMTGAEFTEKIKKIRPELPIILITPSHLAEVAAEVVRKGAYDFLVKPIQFPQLLIAIERALHLKELKKDIHRLREQVKLSAQIAPGIIGKSSKLLNVIDTAKKVAGSNANIFISGESGTGKEVFAKFIHSESKNSNGPFIAINCSAIPENLLESELFGHAKGAFTGAHSVKIGLFEAAENGTLFLDEIGDLSLNLQAKLLRVLQEKEIKRVGENQFRSINARIVSATHKNLGTEIQNGNFREDLFYRLSVIPILIPPLRERIEDILPLAETFLKKFSLENGSPARTFSKGAIKYLLENSWRGNVRELENSIERAVVLSLESEVRSEDFIPSIMINEDSKINSAIGQTDSKQFTLSFQNELPTLEETIQKYIEFAVTYNKGAKDQTARDIGIDRKTLYKRMKVAIDTQ